MVLKVNVVCVQKVLHLQFCYYNLAFTNIYKHILQQFMDKVITYICSLPCELRLLFSYPAKHLENTNIKGKLPGGLVFPHG